MSSCSKSRHTVNSALEGLPPDALTPPLLVSRPVDKEPTFHQSVESCSNDPGMGVVMAVDPLPSSFIVPNPANRPKNGGNPQATLMGLPAELRLEILDHLYPSRLTHVAITGGSRGEGVICTGALTTPKRFTFASDSMAPLRLFWRPCQCPNAPSMTCSRPVWLGTAPAESTCSSTNDPLRYDFGLARTCKTLLDEVLHRVLTHLSMPACDAHSILASLAPHMLRRIQHLVLTPSPSDADAVAPRGNANPDPSLLAVRQLTTTHKLPALRRVTLQRRSLCSRSLRRVPGTVEYEEHAEQSLDGVVFPRDDLADARHRAAAFGRLVGEGGRCAERFGFALVVEYWVVLYAGASFGFCNDGEEVEMLCVRGDVPVGETVGGEDGRGEALGGVVCSRHRVMEGGERARWKGFWMAHVGGFFGVLV